MAVDTREWRDFRLGDLFHKLELKCRKTDFNKSVDCSEVQDDEFSLPLVNAKHYDNGIQYYGRPDDWDSAEMTIDIVSNGAVATGDVFAQPQRTGVLWDAYLIKPNWDCTSEQVLIYLACVIEKCVKQFFSYSDKCTWNKVQDKIIKLPVTPDGMPDWAYMEQYMQAVMDRQAHVIQTLARISKEKHPIPMKSWGGFRVSELFGHAKLGKYHNPNSLIYDAEGYEYICASNLNNGVNKDLPRVTGNNLSLTSANIIAWGKQCPMFTYHAEPCITSQGMYYIELGTLSEWTALFVISVLERACHGQYGYNNCLIGSTFDEIEIFLPVTPEGKPDWDYMDGYIRKVIYRQEHVVPCLAQIQAGRH